jgi:organic radical activating enzyme
MMLSLPNVQRIDTVVYGEGPLEVHSIWPTIQGEGPFAGTPAIFIRLTGCNLQCPMCDTDYTSKRMLMSSEDIIDRINQIRGSGIINHSIIVITGGEPFRQNITELVLDLASVGYMIQIETNGTLWQPTFVRVWERAWKFFPVHIVCSPKLSYVAAPIKRYIDTYKYVLQAGNVDEKDGLPTQTLGYSGRVYRDSDFLIKWPGRIFVQPLDEQNEEKNRANLQVCVDSSMKHGYRLTTQMHKVAGLD